MQSGALTRPVLDPGYAPTIVKAGIAKCPARELLEMMKFLLGNIRDREVSEFNIPLNESRCRQGPGRIGDTLAKKCKLIAEFLASIRP